MMVYGFGIILARALNFLLLPIITRVLSPAEYGQIEMTLVLLNFAMALISLGSQSAISFLFFKTESKDGRSGASRVISAAIQWYLSWGLMVSLLAVLLWPYLNHQFFSDRVPASFFLVALASSYLGQLNAMGLETFRCLFRPWAYLGVSFLSSLVGATITYYCIVHLALGSTGYFLGLLCGASSASLVGWGMLAHLLTIKPQKEMWPKMLEVELPLLPAALVVQALTGADRWYISTYIGQDQLGIYAVGARFALAMQLAVETFRQAWLPIFMQCLHRPDGPQTLRTVSRLYLTFTLSAAIWLATFSKILLHWMVAPQFFLAYPITGVLAWTAVMYGFFSIATAGIWKEGRTSLLPLGMGVAALVNVGLNFLLGPSLGILGCGLASAIAYTVWVAGTLTISETLWRVRFPVGVLAGQMLLGVTTITSIEWLHTQSYPLWQVGTVALMGTLLLSLLGLGLSGLTDVRQVLARQKDGPGGPLGSLGSPSQN